MGLVGAGPWATVVHAPLIAGGPGTSLEVVWARREDAAVELASAYGAAVAGSFEELLARCDAVAFAVPPDIQAGLATRAAQAASTCCSRSRWPSTSGTPNVSRPPWKKLVSPP